MNQDIDAINSMPVENDIINNSVAEDCSWLFQGDSWSEKSLEKSLSGNEVVNDVHLCISNTSDKL